MDVRITGKNYEVSEGLRQHIRQKLGKLDRYLDSAQEADVEITREATRSAADRFRLQVTVRANSTIVRAEQKGGDVHRAIDAVIDVLDQRLVRFKEKHYRRTGHRRPQPIGQVLAPAAEPPGPSEDEAETGSLDIVRVKRIPVKPMPTEEAVEQLELLGHDFYVFREAATERVCVVYRRHDGGYGLIEPEPA